MERILEAIAAGDGWHATAVGMGQVFASLAVVCLLIILLGWYFQSRERPRIAGHRKEALPKPTSTSPEPPAEDAGDGPTPRAVAAAVAVALALHARDRRSGTRSEGDRPRGTPWRLEGRHRQHRRAERLRNRR